MPSPGRARPLGANSSRPKQNPRPPNDLGVTLRKMLQFEQRRGFDDRTVSGGLDAFLRGASAQAGPRSALFAVVAALPQSGYASLPPAARGAWAQRALALLTPARPQPATPRPPVRGPPSRCPPHRRSRAPAPAPQRAPAAQ